MKKYRFSLIVTTQGNREKEFMRFLDSLDSQIFSNYELIVIDQSENFSTTDHLLCKRHFDINHYKTGKRISLSEARNIGLNIAKGDIVAFPDDDCWYPNDLLLLVNQEFNEKSIDCLCCSPYDPISERYLLKRNATTKYTVIKESNALIYPISIGIFAKKFDEIKFNTELGVGAKWGAGEESDYILQLLYRKKHIIYNKDIKVYHPYLSDFSFEKIEKYYNYGKGYGALVKIAMGRNQYGVLKEYVITCLRSIGGTLYYGLRNNKKYRMYFSRLRGMLYGFCKC